MKVVYQNVEDSSDLVHVYNDQLKDTPYFFPVTPEEFNEGILNRINQDGETNLESEKIIVGKQNDKILGFAHVSIGKAYQFGKEKEGGFIHFLTYQPGYRSIGQAIITECEKYLCNFSISQIWAFLHASNYRFYHLGFGHISDKIAHVYGLFGMNGYKIDIGEVFMSYPQYEISEPILPDGKIKIIVTKKESRGLLPDLHVQAIYDDNEIGECISVSFGEFYNAESAQDSFFTKWLGVENEYQGKGLGRYLLQRTLYEMHKAGYKNAVISTNIINYRAQLFYSNFGYKVTDTAYALVKKF